MPLIISLQTCLIVFTNNFPCCLTILQLHCISYIQCKKSLISSFIKISFLLSFWFHSLSIRCKYFKYNLCYYLIIHNYIYFCVYNNNYPSFFQSLKFSSLLTIINFVSIIFFPSFFPSFLPTKIRPCNHYMNVSLKINIQTEQKNNE